MLLAHEVACGFASHEHQANAGHGYLQYAAVSLPSAQRQSSSPPRRRCSGRPAATTSPARPHRSFAVVPLVGFLLQEHLEHLVAARELEVTFFLSTPFVLGLALQIPFAFAALVVARLILGFVARVARAIGTLPRLGALASLSVLSFSARSRSSST